MGILRSALAHVTDRHALDEAVDSNEKRNHNGCSLASGIEYSFVNLFCYELMKSRSFIDSNFYHKLFYIPNLQAEAKVGFDLSIGNYTQLNRIRTMHKVLSERFCDESWVFNISRDSGDYRHLSQLIESSENISPFLILNICFCIHDYRRMGDSFPVGDRLIINPQFNSLGRTIIINLRELNNRINNFLSNDNFNLSIIRQLRSLNNFQNSMEFLNTLEDEENILIQFCGENISTENIVMGFNEFASSDMVWNVMDSFLGE